MKLNRTPNPLDRAARNSENDNWDIIEGEVRTIGDKVDDFVEEISDEAFNKIVDSARLDWDKMVDTFEDLPVSAAKGTTIGVKADGKVYRYDGSNWIDIYEINLNPIAEVDSRLTQQLAEEAQQRKYESMIQRRPLDFAPSSEPEKEETLFISWTDDDGFVEVYDKFKPILEKYNIPITSAIPTSFIGTDDSKYLNFEQLKELADLGMEFVSHSHLHDPNNRLGTMSESEMDLDLSTSKQIMKDLGFNYRGLILPFAGNNYKIQKVTRKHFDYVIGTGADQSKNEPFYPGQYSNYYIRRTRTEFGLDHVKQKIDEAKASKRAWVVLSSHIYEDIYTQDFIESIIDYANSLGFKWVTTLEGYQTFGNIAQFGMLDSRRIDYVNAGTRIAADGTIHSEYIGKVRRMGDRRVGIDTPLDFFFEDTINITKIRQQDNDGFPGASGTLYTYRLDEDVYAYQEYVTTRDKLFYTRYWDHDKEEWTDFHRVNMVRYTKPNHFTPDDIPNDDTQYKITYTQITKDGNVGFPENSSGTLIFNHYSSYSFIYQEYHIYQSAKKYKRFWRPGQEEWSPWRLTESIVAAHHAIENTLTSDKLPADFEVGITNTYISTVANDTGIPERSGNLITYKFSGGIGRTYQEFRGYRSYNKYIRYERGDGIWSAWKRYVLESV